MQIEYTITYFRNVSKGDENAIDAAQQLIRKAQWRRNKAQSRADRSCREEWL